MDQDQDTTAPAADPHRAAYTAGLRQLAGILDAHPELPLPFEGGSAGRAMSFHFLFGADPRAALAAAARARPCTLAKNVRDYGEHGAYLDLAGQLAGLHVELTAYRDDVCTRRVTGTEDREVEETVTPAVTRKVTRTVDVVEWECHPVMAPAGGAA